MIFCKCSSQGVHIRITVTERSNSHFLNHVNNSHYMNVDHSDNYPDLYRLNKTHFIPYIISLQNKGDVYMLQKYLAIDINTNEEKLCMI